MVVLLEYYTDSIGIQEEPKNMGAWAYVQPRLATALRELCRGREHTDVRYVGRATSATTATGSFQVHLMEMKAITNAAFDIKDIETSEERVDVEPHVTAGSM